MAEPVEQASGVAVHAETVRRALDARAFNVKSIHCDVDARNSDTNKHKRREYAIKFYAAIATKKSILWTKPISTCGAHVDVDGA